MLQFCVLVPNVATVLPFPHSPAIIAKVARGFGGSKITDKDLPKCVIPVSEDGETYKELKGGHYAIALDATP